MVPRGGSSIGHQRHFLLRSLNLADQRKNQFVIRFKNCKIPSFDFALLFFSAYMTWSMLIGLPPTFYPTEAEAKGATWNLKYLKNTFLTVHSIMKTRFRLSFNWIRIRFMNYEFSWRSTETLNNKMVKLSRWDANLGGLERRKWAWQVTQHFLHWYPLALPAHWIRHDY